jgi:PAS domain-containing protein
VAKSQLDSATLIRTIRNTLAFHPQDQQIAPQSLRKRSRAVERSADTIFITDLHGVIEYVNPAFENLTGQERDEVCCRTSRISKSSERAPEVYPEIRETILAGNSYRGIRGESKKEWRVVLPGREHLPVRDALRQVTQFLSKGVISLSDYGWKPSFCRLKRGMRWGIWRAV